MINIKVLGFIESSGIVEIDEIHILIKPEFKQLFSLKM